MDRATVYCLLHTVQREKLVSIVLYTCFTLSSADGYFIQCVIFKTYVLVYVLSTRMRRAS